MDIKTYLTTFMQASKASQRIKLKIGNILESDRNVVAFFTRLIKSGSAAYEPVLLESDFYENALGRRSYMSALVEFVIRYPQAFNYTNVELNQIVDLFNDNTLNVKFFDQLNDAFRKMPTYNPAFIDKEAMLQNVLLTDPLFKKWYPKVTAKDYLTYYNVYCDNVTVMLMTAKLLELVEAGKVPVDDNQKTMNYLLPILKKEANKWNDGLYSDDAIESFIEVTVLAPNVFKTLRDQAYDASKSKSAPKPKVDKIGDVLSFL